MHATICDVIIDTVQNSIEADSSKILLKVVDDGSFFSVEIEDDGKGMNEDVLARAFNPFYTEPGKHDKRRVGLGLPILKQLCDATGGKVEFQSVKGVGTKLRYSFLKSHIDLPPIGNLADTILALFNYPGNFELVYTRIKGDSEYSISRTELSESVGGFENVESLSLAREFLRSQEFDCP